MRISSEALQICLGIRNYEEIKGIKPFVVDEETLKTNSESIREELINAGLFELKADKDEYIFSALGDLIINMMAKPDVWISFEKNGVKTNIYIRGEIYAHVAFSEGYCDIILLPSLPLVFGACADAIDDANNTDSKMFIEGESNNSKLQLTIENGNTIILVDESGKVDSRDDLFINSLIQWIIFGLKDIEWKGDMQV